METPPVTLTPDERTRLGALLLDSSARARRRSRIVLDWASGKELKSIARELPMRRARAEHVVTAFLEKRLDIFFPAALKRASTHAAAYSPEPSPSNPITMRQAAHRILGQQYKKLRDCEEGVHEAEDSEAVHDMRVACRRLNSAFRLFRKDLPAKPVKRLRPTLEKLRDTLGEARNLDVMLQDLNEFCATLPSQQAAQLSAIVAAWQDERANVQQTLQALLASPAYKKWCERMEAFLLGDDGSSGPRVAHVLPALLWTQYGAVRVYETRLTGASLEELHALRIEIKRLRYTLEFFRDVFEPPATSASEQDTTQDTDSTTGDAPPAPKRTPATPSGEAQAGPSQLIEALVTLQDRLGSIQDAVVSGEALADFIVAQALAAKKRHEPVPEFQGIADYHSYLSARIEGLRESLPERWNVVTAPAFRRQLAHLTANL